MAVALPFVSLAFGAIGTAVSVIGGITSANAQAANASYQAQVAANNATIANRNAVAATQSGEAKAEAQGLKNRAELARLAVGQAASGIDVKSGSPVDVRVTDRETGLEDVDTIRHNAFMQAYGYQSQSSNFQSQAEIDKATASNATALAPITAGASAISGLSALGTKWTQFDQAGAFGGSSSGSGFNNISSDASNPLTYG